MERVVAGYAKVKLCSAAADYIRYHMALYSSLITLKSSPVDTGLTTADLVNGGSWGWNSSATMRPLLESGCNSGAEHAYQPLEKRTTGDSTRMPS